MALLKLQEAADCLRIGLPFCFCTGALPDDRIGAKAIFISDHACINLERVAFLRQTDKLGCPGWFVIDVLNRAGGRAGNRLKIALTIDI